MTDSPYSPRLADWLEALADREDAGHSTSANAKVDEMRGKLVGMEQFWAYVFDTEDWHCAEDCRALAASLRPPAGGGA